MAIFGIGSSEFLQLLRGGDASKLYRALKRAMEEWDLDTKWKTKPTGGVFTHDLKVVPRLVVVMGSDEANGSDYVQELATSVTRTTITVGGSKANYRILAQR